MLRRFTKFSFSISEIDRCWHKLAAVAVELAGSGLTEEERETFYKALALITENLQRLGREGLPQRCGGCFL